MSENEGALTLNRTGYVFLFVGSILAIRFLRLSRLIQFRFLVRLSYKHDKLAELELVLRLYSTR